MDRLDDSGLKALLEAEIENALGYVGKLSEQRRKALFYYYGEAKEDLSPPEVDGRSSAVSTDLSDVVEWIMPALMKMFAGGDEVVQFLPRKGSDEDAADQMTALCNYIWEKNDGFKVYHNWFKDALLEKTGIVKIWWDNRQERKREEYQNLTDLQLALLDQDDSLEIIEHDKHPAPPPMPMPGMPPMPPMSPQMGPDGQPIVPMLHDVTVIRSKKKNQICVENVPPEEFLISRRAKSIEDAPFICHRTPKTQSDLIAAGYPEKLIDGLSTDERIGEFNAERVERTIKDDESPYGQTQALQTTQDRSQRVFWVAECYLKVDWDGDGIAELRKITKIGQTILDNEEIDAKPFAALTPILMPHRFFGRSLYDVLAQLQKIKTAVLRGALDSIYLATSPRFGVIEGQANLDDLLASRPGGIVRMKSAGAVTPLTSTPVHEGAFTALEFLDGWRENIAGVTKYNQGTDANSLNKTAHGVDAIMQASNQRIELIGRVFAETGVKDAFLLVQKLLLQYQKQSLAIRTNGKFVDVDPRVWANEYDMTVATGLGTGSKGQQVAQLTQVMQMQQQAVGAGMILPKGLLHSAQKLLEAMGFKDTENFLPLPNPASQDPSDHPQPPQPNPMVQAEQIKASSAQQLASTKAQADIVIEQARSTADQQIQQHKISTNAQLDEQKARMQMALDDHRHAREQDTALKIARIEAEAKIVVECIAKGLPLPATGLVSGLFATDMGGGMMPPAASPAMSPMGPMNG